MPPSMITKVSAVARMNSTAVSASTMRSVSRVTKPGAKTSISTDQPSKQGRGGGVAQRAAQSPGAAGGRGT